MEICRYWMEDRCRRRPCPYAHPPKKQQQHHQASGTSDLAAPLQQRTNCRRRSPDYYSSPPSQKPARDFAPAAICKMKKELARHSSAASPSQKPDFAQPPACDQTKEKSVNDHSLTTSTPAVPSRKRGAAPCAYKSNRKIRREPLESKSSHDTDSICKKNIGVQQVHQQVASPTLISNLAGHEAAASIIGVASPLSSQTLFSVGEDATMRAWSCSTGECTDIVRFETPVSCLYNSQSDPDWAFIGLLDKVSVFNLSAKAQVQTLPVSSPVLSLSSLGHLLLAGLQQGSILIWRYDTSSASFQPLTCLQGDHSPVLAIEPSLVPGSNVVYAGSADGTIRIWDVATGRCLQALSAHSQAITQLLACNDTCILSASRDGSIKLWKVSVDYQTSMELQYTYVPKSNEDNMEGSSCDVCPLALCGVYDESNTAILFAAFSDSKIRILEVPSFACRGTLSTSKPIRAMDIGCSNRLFLGSSCNGELSVWKWK